MHIYEVRLEDGEDGYSYWIRAEDPDQAAALWAAHIRKEEDDPDLLDDFFPANVMVMQVPELEGEPGVATGGLVFRHVK